MYVCMCKYVCVCLCVWSICTYLCVWVYGYICVWICGGGAQVCICVSEGLPECACVCVFLCFHGVLGGGPRDIWGVKTLRHGETHVWMPLPANDLNLPWGAVECKGSSLQAESWVDLAQARHLRQHLLFPYPDHYKGNSINLHCSLLPPGSPWFSFPVHAWVELFSLSFDYVNTIDVGSKLGLRICFPPWTMSTMRSGLFLLCILGPSTYRHHLDTK